MKSDTVTIPRFEYEALLKRAAIREEPITPAIKRALVRARKDFKLGKYFTYDEFAKEMAASRSRRSRQGK